MLPYAAESSLTQRTEIRRFRPLEYAVETETVRAAGLSTRRPNMQCTDYRAWFCWTETYGTLYTVVAFVRGRRSCRRATYRGEPYGRLCIREYDHNASQTTERTVPQYYPDSRWVMVVPVFPPVLHP